jgi:uncharacterized protein YfiM (DUF2279 family)
MHSLLLVFSLQFGRGPGTVADAGWFAPDKAKHFFTSAFVQSVAFSGLRAARVGKTGSLVGATVVSGTVAVGKEWYDSRCGGDPSVKDLAADGAGILAASLLLGHTVR